MAWYDDKFLVVGATVLGVVGEPIASLLTFSCLGWCKFRMVDTHMEHSLLARKWCFTYSSINDILILSPAHWPAQPKDNGRNSSVSWYCVIFGMSSSITSHTIIPNHNILTPSPSPEHHYTLPFIRRSCFVATAVSKSSITVRLTFHFSTTAPEGDQ